MLLEEALLLNVTIECLFVEQGRMDGHCCCSGSRFKRLAFQMHTGWAFQERGQALHFRTALLARFSMGACSHIMHAEIRDLRTEIRYAR